MNFDAFLPLVQDKLPKNDAVAIMTLKERFAKLDESKKQEVAAQIPLLKLQSPALVFWVGSFFFGNFGVGRFMIGDIALGVVRLVLTLLVITFYLTIHAAADEQNYSAALGGLIFYYFFNTINFIWWIVDLFLVGKKLRRKNLEKIMQILY